MSVANEVDLQVTKKIVNYHVVEVGEGSPASKLQPQPHLTTIGAKVIGALASTKKFGLSLAPRLWQSTCTQQKVLVT
jgi:hypothetical protein